LRLAEGLRQFAESRGHTVLELALSWLASRPAVASIIAGATSPEQVRANVRAADWKLSDADLVEVDRILAAQSGSFRQ
jgi:aryl-alcohol dehydrogenase-like predicted oxidoreductase